MWRRHGVVVRVKRVTPSIRRVIKALIIPAVGIVVIGWPEYVIKVAREIVVIDVDVADVRGDRRAKPLAVVIVP